MLGQFDPAWATNLLQFAKDVPSADADAFVFMARKSVCLYDVLVGLGAPPVEKPLLTDRALDCNLEALHGKRVMLVDDTLILGTTLAKAKQRLESLPGTAVDSMVFCRNAEWARDDLFTPGRVYLDLSDSSTRSFCASEVLAFSLFPRPYVSDFPTLGPLRVRAPELQCLLSSTDFAARNLSSSLQLANDISVFSFFPGASLREELRRAWGDDLADLVDLTKVRAFGTRSNEAVFFQVVPVVTLKPLYDRHIQDITEHVLSRLSSRTGTDSERILHNVREPVAQQRLIGYLLASSLGRRWVRSVEADLQRDIDVSFNQVEADRLFGPWIGPEVQAMSEGSDALLEPPAATARRWVAAQPSTEALALAKEALPQSTDQQRADRVGQDLIVADFCRAFLRLYDRREIPARQEVHALGSRAMDAGPDEAPNRDRLEVGLAWSSLVDWFCATYDAGRGEDTIATLSLVLDICNDLGIAVPVTSHRGGVVMRGYRHGEDVKFADSEPDLVLSMVRGFLEGSERNDVPRLWMEKLLVMLLSIGAAKGFIKPLYGETSMPGSVRVKFNLKGAIPVITTGPRSQLDSEQWLSRYLLERGVLRLTPNRLFTLGPAVGTAEDSDTGESVGGAQPAIDAMDQAFALGSITGALLGGIEGAAPALDSNDLVVLTTCHPPRHAAGAIATELSIFEKWWGREGRRLLRMPVGDARSVLSLLLRSHGYEALHSSRFKFDAYRNRHHLDVIDRASTALENAGGGYRLLSRTWTGYWAVADATRNVHEQALLDPPIDAAMLLIWQLAGGTLLAEYALAAQDGRESGGRRRAAAESARRKLREFDAALSSHGLRRPAALRQVSQQTKKLDEGGEPGAAMTVAADVVAQAVEEIVMRAQVLQREVDSFGRLAGRHEYSYLLWYDVVDSTGTEASRRGLDVEEHRRRVASFKQNAIVLLQELSYRAQRRQAEVFAWNGDIDSTNDEKHLFFSGNFASRWLTQLLESLMLDLASIPTVYIRAHIIPCGFAGSSVYRYAGDAEVVGQRFWEHGSRLRKHLRSQEGGHPGEGSFFAMAGDLASTLKLPDTLRWSGCHEELVDTEIEGLRRSTPVRWGRLTYSARDDEDGA